jgi:hypothetical protein
MEKRRVLIAFAGVVSAALAIGPDLNAVALSTACPFVLMYIFLLNALGPNNWHYRQVFPFLNVGSSQSISSHLP